MPKIAAGALLKQRLENWGACQRGGSVAGSGVMHAKETRSASPYGGQGYKCMTSVVCNILATQAPKGNTAAKSSRLNHDDARIVTTAWLLLSDRSKSMLKHCYVYNSPADVICRRLSIRHWPASAFKRELEAAEAEIQKMLDSIENRNTIPANNSFPSEKACGSQKAGATVPGGSEEEAPD